MKIEKTDFGKRVYIKNGNFVWKYTFLNVKVVNASCKRQHPIIEMLAKEERKTERKLLILLHSLERSLELYHSSPNKDEWFDEFKRRNRLNFYKWYHSQIDDLIFKIKSYSEKYSVIAQRDGYEHG